MCRLHFSLALFCAIFTTWSCVGTNPTAPDTKTNGSQVVEAMPPSGTTIVFAGSGTMGWLDGSTSNAQFADLAGMAFDSSGNLWVADYGTNKIRKVSSAFQVSTVAGSGAALSIDGTGAAASIMGPACIAIDTSGNMYVGENTGHRIRKITPAGVVTTFCGSGIASNINGTGTNASFNYPVGLCIDASGNLFVAESQNHLIRKITSSGVVTTLAGSGTMASIDGTGTSASFSSPVSIAIDSSGNLFVCDFTGCKIRKVTSAGVVTTFVGSGSVGTNDGTGTSAKFSNPGSICIDQATGTLYVSDWGSLGVRKITSSGVVTTIPTTAMSSQGMVFYKGYIYFGDHGNRKILKIAP